MTRWRRGSMEEILFEMLVFALKSWSEGFLKGAGADAYAQISHQTAGQDYESFLGQLLVGFGSLLRVSLAQNTVSNCMGYIGESQSALGDYLGNPTASPEIRLQRLLHAIDSADAAVSRLTQPDVATQGLANYMLASSQRIACHQELGKIQSGEETNIRNHVHDSLIHGQNTLDAVESTIRARFSPVQHYFFYRRQPARRNDPNSRPEWICTIHLVCIIDGDTVMRDTGISWPTEYGTDHDPNPFLTKPDAIKARDDYLNQYATPLQEDRDSKLNALLSQLNPIRDTLSAWRSYLG